MTLVDKHMNEINRLCAVHKVKQLYVFGSVLTNKFNTDSDVDFIVNFEPIEVLQYADNYYGLKFSLEEIFKRPIDLLEEKALKNPYFKKAIDNNKKLIYGY